MGGGEMESVVGYSRRSRYLPHQHSIPQFIIHSLFHFSFFAFSQLIKKEETSPTLNQFNKEEKV